MSNNIIIGIVLVLLIAVLGVWVMAGSKRVRWYKVYLANNDVLLLRRDLNERFWRTSDRYMRFKDEFGKEITFPSNAHWVLMWQEVPKNEIEIVKQEIRNMKIKKQEAE